jgi:hypothetical protein
VTEPDPSGVSAEASAVLVARFRAAAFFFGCSAASPDGPESPASPGSGAAAVLAAARFRGAAFFFGCSVDASPSDGSPAGAPASVAGDAFFVVRLRVAFFATGAAGGPAVSVVSGVAEPSA